MNNTQHITKLVNDIRTFASNFTFPVKISYCQCAHPANAGDYYTDWLMQQLGFPTELNHNHPQLYISGSILSTPLQHTPGIVWGLGAANYDEPVVTKNMIHAVRGTLTAEKLSANIPTGDPGCLAPLFIKPEQRSHNKPVIGIIPHYIDEDSFAKNLPSSDRIEFKLISMRTVELAELLTQIADCDFVVSSSLHGVIFAHAFMKPCIHIELNELSSKNNFKFRDYFSNLPSLNYDGCHIKLKDEHDLLALNWSHFLANPNKYRPAQAEIEHMQVRLLENFPLMPNSEHSSHEPLSKSYNGERAIISITSWSKRIHIVGKTIFSILSRCPKFHVVLVLSKKEFPHGLSDLPRDLQLMCKRKLIEILWTCENMKSLKKVLYTIEHYPFVPVISADDDLCYICNYAGELYDLWIKNPEKICTINAEQPLHTNGTATLYFPGCFGFTPIREMLNNKHLDIYTNADDGYYELLRARYNIKIAYLPPHKIWVDQNGTCPLHDIYGKPGYLDKLRQIQSADLGRPIGL